MCARRLSCEALHCAPCARLPGRNAHRDATPCHQCVPSIRMRGCLGGGARAVGCGGVRAVTMCHPAHNVQWPRTQPLVRGPRMLVCEQRPWQCGTPSRSEHGCVRLRGGGVTLLGSGWRAGVRAHQEAVHAHALPSCPRRSGPTGCRACVHSGRHAVLGRVPVGGLLPGAAACAARARVKAWAVHTVSPRRACGRCPRTRLAMRCTKARRHDLRHFACGLPCPCTPRALCCSLQRMVRCWRTLRVRCAGEVAAPAAPSAHAVVCPAVHVAAAGHVGRQSVCTARVQCCRRPARGRPSPDQARCGTPCAGAAQAGPLRPRCSTDAA